MAHTEKKNISQNIADFRRTKNIHYLFAAFVLVIRQKRFLEVVFGIYCFLFHKPSKIEEDNEFQITDHISNVKKHIVERRKQREKILLEVSNQLCGKDTTLYSSDHGYILNETGFILGEYAEHSARIFVKSADELTICQFYQTVPGVRHIHSILQSGESLFVSTGDSNKFLDRWHCSNGRLKFERRILHKLGGFSACCRIKGKHFFGSDFSERPNYIFCLDTGQKWYFPKPAYTQYCYRMFPLDDRYIFCVNISLPNISQRRTITVFDTQTWSFVYCHAYHGRSGLRNGT